MGKFRACLRLVRVVSHDRLSLIEVLNDSVYKIAIESWPSLGPLSYVKAVEDDGGDIYLVLLAWDRGYG